MRYIHENPPLTRAKAFAFGVQEAFVRRFGTTILLEAAPIDEPPGSNFFEVSQGFIARATKLSNELENQACAYWATTFASMHNDAGIETQVPVMHGIMLAPKRLVSYCLESLTDELDFEQSRHMAHLGIALSRLMPPVSGDAEEQACSNQLFEAIREGLTIGFDSSQKPARKALSGMN